MSKIKLLSAYIVIIMIEVLFPQHLKIYNIAPDLSLIFVVFVGLYCGGREGAITGFIAGLVKDSFSASPFGVEAALFCAIGALSGKLNNIIYKESPAANLIILFPASIVVGVAFASKLGVRAFVYILYTSCLAPLIFKFLKKAV